ncbi:glycoside hydrolase N-terminal domain-containing protein [Cohnella sp. GCM10020058]|uniref:glycoside hydrolase N-terminal domain-containing protein n=1 Tax=Cohnella sp. GCM10020058 TaxID=3317330 RepID=UPI00363FE64B
MNRDGYTLTRPAARWEEGLLCGNGTIGAIVMGEAASERIVLSHERLFIPFNQEPNRSRWLRVCRLSASSSRRGARPRPPRRRPAAERRLQLGYELAGRRRRSLRRAQSFGQAVSDRSVRDVIGVGSLSNFICNEHKPSRRRWRRAFCIWPDSARTAPESQRTGQNQAFSLRPTI